MSRSLRALGISAAAIAAAAVAAPFALADRNDAGHHATIVLAEQNVEAHLIDNPAPAQFDGTNPTPNQAGDTITFVSNLARGGTKVGGLAGQCTVLDAAGTLQDCSVTITLGKGSLRVAGPFGASGGTLTILGGTGRFAHATGSDTIVDNPDGSATHTIAFTRS